MMKFKVGQTVELVDNSQMVALLGAAAEVKEVWGTWLLVVWKLNNSGQMDGYYGLHKFKIKSIKCQQLLFDFAY